MAKERKDNSEWKNSRPPQGSSGKDFANWAKQNPNRIANANERLKEFEQEPTTATVEGTAARAEMVGKWKAAMPQGGANVTDSAEGAANRRKEFIEWAKWNPNKASNARRAKKKK
jgi:hypothetical protein